MTYLLIVGNTPELAKEELRSLLAFKELLFKPPVLVLETDQAIPFDRLGGTVKVGEVISEPIAEVLRKLPRRDFGISNYGGKEIDPKEIKRQLGKARFVLPTKGRELSSVVVRKQKLTEFLVVDNFIAKTIWVQDFEAWNHRDYDRPEVEAHIGMLPPKVARMMINVSQGMKILDPFCGVGTIISEAKVLGLEAIGSDINPKQVERTKKNLEFFNQQADVFVADATRISEKVTSVDAIVTEADLGPRDDLDRLYLDCLTDWRKTIKQGGRIVMAMANANVVDKARSIGYILEAGPFEYARPQAKVKRNICVFRYGTH